MIAAIAAWALIGFVALAVAFAGLIALVELLAVAESDGWFMNDGRHGRYQRDDDGATYRRRK